MTYCLGLSLQAGLVAMADSRTNAGVDNISTFGKLFTWSAPDGPSGPRAFALMTAGNLSVTQEIVSLIDEQIAANGPSQDGGLVTLYTAPSMFRAAEHIGGLMTDVQGRWSQRLAAGGVSAGASLLFMGAVGAAAPELYLVYQAGNVIRATPDTPFMQIGEFKYGKPILDRMVTSSTSLPEGVKAAGLSMAATLRSNLSVGMPLDLAVLPAGSHVWSRRRIEPEDAVFQQLADNWGAHLRAGFAVVPDIAY